MHGSTNKSLIKLNTAKIKLTRVICFQMRKICIAKTPLGDFKITILKNPLLSKQSITSKSIPVPYTNL